MPPTETLPFMVQFATEVPSKLATSAMPGAPAAGTPFTLQLAGLFQKPSLPAFVQFFVTANALPVTSRINAAARPTSRFRRRGREPFRLWLSGIKAELLSSRFAQLFCE